MEGKKEDEPGAVEGGSCAREDKAREDCTAAMSTAEFMMALASRLHASALDELGKS